MKERGYSDNLVRGQTLKARKYLRSEVLNKQKREGNKNDREHRKAFGKVPIIEFRRAKSLKNILVRAKVEPLEKKEGMFKTIHR